MRAHVCTHGFDLGSVSLICSDLMLLSGSVPGLLSNHYCVAKCAVQLITSGAACLNRGNECSQALHFHSYSLVKPCRCYSASQFLVLAQDSLLCAAWPDSRGKNKRAQSTIPVSRKALQRQLSTQSGSSSKNCALLLTKLSASCLKKKKVELFLHHCALTRSSVLIILH